MPRVKSFNRKDHEDSRYTKKAVNVSISPPHGNSDTPNLTKTNSDSSASKRKISYFLGTTENLSDTCSDNVIVDLGIISDLVQKHVMCKYCKNVNSMKIVEEV